MPVGGAGVEPHVQRVADLFRSRRPLIAQQLGGSSLNQVSMPSEFDALGDFFHQLHGARVQLAGFRCRKKGIGTPQLRWREMHQSGRLAIIACRRAWPQAGKKRGGLDACSATLRRLGDAVGL